MDDYCFSVTVRKGIRFPREKSIVTVNEINLASEMISSSLNLSLAFLTLYLTVVSGYLVVVSGWRQANHVPSFVCYYPLCGIFTSLYVVELRGI